MDWSLVLVSQGIEVVIEAANDEHGWQLVLAAADSSRAFAALRHYHAENRRRPWVQTLPWTGLAFDWRSAVWFAWLIVIFFLGETRFPHLRAAGLMDSSAVWAGQWWRLFTAVSLHGDLAHLIGNVTTGVLLLGLAMGGHGAGHALLAAYLAGAGGNVANLLLHPDAHRSLGASGMVMGALGLLTAQSLTLLRAGLTPRQFATRGLLAGVLLMVLLGLNPDTDVVAHVAGFLAGVLLGGLLALAPTRLLQSPQANRFAELLCGALMILTWRLALH